MLCAAETMANNHQPASSAEDAGIAAVETTNYITLLEYTGSIDGDYQNTNNNTINPGISAAH